MSIKQLAIDAIHGLPEHATWLEIEERIHFVAAIEKGQEDIRLGRVVPHEVVEASLQNWLIDREAP